MLRSPVSGCIRSGAFAVRKAVTMRSKVCGPNDCCVQGEVFDVNDSVTFIVSLSAELTPTFSLPEIETV